VATAAARWEAASKAALAQWNSLLEQVRAEVNPSLEKANLKPLAVR